MPDPVVVRCPTCRHLVNIPEDYLGRVVTCLECHTPFTAPVRDGDRLTEPVARPRRGLPPAVVVPLVGLLLLGAAGLAVNGYLYHALGTDPEAGKALARGALRALAAERPADEPTPAGLTPEQAKEWKADRQRRFQDDQERRIEEQAAEWAPSLQARRPVRLAFAAVSLGVFAGGLAFALRRFYPLAFVGCGLAAINSPDLGCCFPGAVVGVWGFFVLISDGGRRYFRK
jgi:hypothetical protein